ncbi:MAG: hypothetical protein EHM61_09995 [Acidobacteria bacterium]|nr:MAG: hypothetical protein EHM61_09995 [Acidobacteriota bacterium]
MNADKSRGKGSEGQRGKGAKGQRGKGAEGQREGPGMRVSWLSACPLCPFTPLPLCPFDPLILCPFAPGPKVPRETCPG